MQLEGSPIDALAALLEQTPVQVSLAGLFFALRSPGSLSGALRSGPGELGGQKNLSRKPGVEILEGEVPLAGEAVKSGMPRGSRAAF